MIHKLLLINIVVDANDSKICGSVMHRCPWMSEAGQFGDPDYDPKPVFYCRLFCTPIDKHLKRNKAGRVKRHKECRYYEQTTKGGS